jgi:hypothetical protein
MTSKTITVVGLRVELFEQSFKVEGMSEVIWVGPHMTESSVRQLVEAVYHEIKAKAEKAGRIKAAEALYQLAMRA